MDNLEVDDVGIYVVVLKFQTAVLIGQKLVSAVICTWVYVRLFRHFWWTSLNKTIIKITILLLVLILTIIQ